ncbi:hypothetical protein ESCO_005459 [Escovopsis weberi]|uniref:Uncharacterized protein n=1 Tax=Escovopsis weberi TaxID=150374 RepID=A0A0M8N4Q1_ESCWE|nr:hypothetical protein ESCO_005459 [Escovopsis weberi]
MSSAPHPPAPQDPGAQAHPSPEKALPAPPLPEDANANANAPPATARLDLSAGATTVRLDALGPMVVNQDGTISRISNWAKMSEIEQTNTLRIIGKRNKTRLEVLRRAQGADSQDGPQA